MDSNSCRYNSSLMQIQDRREIRFLSVQAELRHIGDPLLVWFFSLEVSIQRIGRNFFSYFIFVCLLYPLQMIEERGTKKQSD